MSDARGLHWFRHDLRLRDNTALQALVDRVDAWLPVFVLDPAFRGDDRALPRVRFLEDCLRRLRDELAERNVTLCLREGKPEEVLPELVRALEIDFVSFGEADTPLAKRRDERVREALEAAGAEVVVVRDHTVFGPDEIRTQQGDHYSVFTPYKRSWWKAWKDSPRLEESRMRLPDRALEPPKGRAKGGSAKGDPIAEIDLPGDAPELPTGGEDAARRRLRAFLDDGVERYADDRDKPFLDGTSRLSPYLRFGVISVRRCFTKALEHLEEHPSHEEGVQTWMDELVWREFYAMVLATSPHVLSGAYRPEYDALEWQGSDAWFEAWCEGRTGYPFVDAGMRQLRATGWMHNRVRMVVASFLTKDLLIDWRRGERFFFESLVDGDPASNNGGWQWAASTGTDAQPYFRIFNPVSQGERFDPDGEYVRRWVPELEDFRGKPLHAPWKADSPPEDYPAPIVDHAEQREEALRIYKKARQQKDG